MAQTMTAGGRMVVIATALSLLLGSAPQAAAISAESLAGGIAFSKKVTTWKDLKFRDMVRQTSDYSCGAAALATILTYYFGKATSESDILTYVFTHSPAARVAEIKERGLSLLDLKTYAEQQGYKSDGYKVKADRLSRLNRPAIALINYNGYSHFVVLKGVADGQVFLADPARGNITVPVDEFTKIWNEILLIFKRPSGMSEVPKAFYTKSNGLHKNGVLSNQVSLGFVIGPSEFSY